jgi:aspartate/methionine/tyrosine aminotransferase
MRIEPFATEQYYALYEFNTPHLLSVSDCETLSVGELLALAGMDSADFNALTLGYTESQGNPDLRRQIAAQYDLISAEDVIVLTSPEEGIFLTMHTLLEPGDEVIVLTPAYDSLRNLAAHVAGAVIEWPVVASENGWQLDLNRLKQLVSDKTKLIVVNFPHNPTGLLPTADEMQALVGLAAQHGVWLLCDEMYRGLERNSAETLPSAADLYERAIVLSGLSKTHGLPGLRAGWLLVRDEKLRAELIDWKHYTTICPPAPSEFLAAAALQASDTLIARNRTIIADNLALAEPFFQCHTDLFSWRRPQAASVAFVEIHVPSATEYCHALAEEAGVLLLPSSCMNYGDGHVRFGFGRKSFPDALAHYDAFLSQ